MATVVRSKPPAVVREAVANFRPVGNFKLLPPEASETSLIHDWGVRVKHEWCQKKPEQQNKRKRDDIITLEDSDLAATDPERFARLLETQKIINLNQAFSSGEADESMVINALIKKPEMNVTVNAKQVHHAMIELYASAKKEVTDMIKRARLENFGSLTLMCDFWSCPVTKSLGLRVYFIDEAFKLKTVLLVVREFNPPFADRQHFQTCFLTWVQSILEDFKLNFDDFLCGSSDAGSDCHALLKTNLKYEWEWCVVHMSHAATKAACGMTGGPSVTLNPGMEALLRRVSTTISTVKAVEAKGSLFKTLCQMKTQGKSTQLADYTPARFLSITTALQRVLEKWDALEVWYNTQSETSRTRSVTFPLKNDKNELIQLVSLLEPIRQLKVMSQATAPNQVSVLLCLYYLRMHTLRDDSALEHYQSTESDPIWIPNGRLTPLTLMTRKFLQQAFDDGFFERYVVAKKTEAWSFIFEMQQKVHPTFKCPERSLLPIVRMCLRQKGMDLKAAHADAKAINERITGKLCALMIANAGNVDAEAVGAPTPVFVSPDRLTGIFGRA